MILKLRLELAYWLDLAEQKLRRLGEKLGWPQAWLHEFIAYRGDPRMTIEEFWVRYTMLRMDAEQKYMNRQLSEAEAREFYTTHEYMLWRNLVHRRHVRWRRVEVTMGRKLLEFGAGIGPVSRYCIGDDRALHMMELDGPARRYAMRRLAWLPHESVVVFEKFIYAEPEYDVITALDAFEHLTAPLQKAAGLVMCLKRGGYLHANIHFNESANDLDLASREQLEATENYLHSTLKLVWRKGEYCVWQKSR